MAMYNCITGMYYCISVLLYKNPAPHGGAGDCRRLRRTRSPTVAIARQTRWSDYWLSCGNTLSSSYSNTVAWRDFVAAIATRLTTNCLYYTIKRAGATIRAVAHRDQSLSGSDDLLAVGSRFLPFVQHYIIIVEH